MLRWLRSAKPCSLGIVRFVAGAAEQDLAAEPVRVRHPQGRFGAIELDRAMTVLGARQKTHRDRDDGAGREFQRAGYMRRDLDANALPRRSARGSVATPATRATGPSRLTSAVR